MSDKVKVPDVLGKANRVQMLAAALTQLQQQRFDLTLRQTAEGAAPSDPSGYAAPSGASLSYADRFAKIGEGEQALMREHADLLPDIEALVAARGED